MKAGRLLDLRGLRLTALLLVGVGATGAGVGATGPALRRATRLGPLPKATPRRVVTLAPSLTEMVLALGKGETLVGVSRFDTGREVAHLPRVGGFADPSVEAVVALAPELLLVQPAPGNQRPVEKLAELGTPVLALPLQSIQDVEEGLKEVGAALGVPQRGAALAERLEATRREVAERGKGLRPVRVLFVYGFSPLVVAGPGSFADPLMRDAGAVNAAGEAGSPYPVYSVERVLRDPPEVIVDATDTPRGREALEGLLALKAIRWVKLPSERLLHPGPQLGEGLVELFRVLHPNWQPNWHLDGGA